MLSFWANIEESEIEAFAGTLILPTYMSHLSLAPFQLANQPHNADGKQPFILTYVGDGRVEQLAVDPHKHALDLLRFVFPTLDREALRIPVGHPIWIWSNSATSGENLRLFFEPIRQTLDAAPDPHRFSPFQTYVSVSRKELFIGMQIITEYFQAWIRSLTNDPEDGTNLTLERTATGIGFSTSKLGGELLVENDAVFQDILRFSGLKTPLAEIAPLALPDLDSPETQIGEAGILFRLKPV